MDNEKICWILSTFFTLEQLHSILGSIASIYCLLRFDHHTQQPTWNAETRSWLFSSPTFNQLRKCLNMRAWRLRRNKERAREATPRECSSIFIVRWTKTRKEDSWHDYTIMDCSHSMMQTKLCLLHCWVKLQCTNASSCRLDDDLLFLLFPLVKLCDRGQFHQISGCDGWNVFKWRPIQERCWQSHHTSQL